MSPTLPARPNDLSGLDALLAGQPLAQSPRGGNESGFTGQSGERSGGSKPAGGDPSQQAQGDPQQPFAGLGPLLESDPKDVFQQTHGLVLRQELIAINHLALDAHWTYVKLGYPWSILEKEPDRDVYKHRLPYGSAAVRIQAVPNKVWDLIKKTASALLVDFPEAEAEPADDSEEAESACDLANRFLSIDGSEQGTNDAVLFHDRVTRSLTCASAYLECWTDPTGGGYVPLQIKAHPQAQDATQPFVGPDGMPTQDYVLRYVTPQQQFTTDPSQAAPQWQPKLRAARWGREHVRVFPESAKIEDAEKVIILGHCTISEARRRWPDVGQMDDTQLTALTDWTPVRFLALLPPFMRARWKLTDGREKERQGSSDERTLFYYHVFVKPNPDYPKGADVVISGADGGTLFDRRLLAKPVEVPTPDGPKQEVRCMEIPVVQVTPFDDPDDLDPSGRAYVEIIAGAAENNAALALNFAHLVNKIIKTPFTVSATSGVDEDQVNEAMENGGLIPVIDNTQAPKPLTPPPLPTPFFDMYQLGDEAINSAGQQSRPSQGSDNQAEVSGKARQIAVNQNNVGLAPPQTAVNNAYARWCRVKIERAMSDFSTPQQINYVGEDGSYKQSDWTGVDFALVGKVSIKAGTGTLMPPDQKVQYIGNLQAAMLLPPDEAAEAARPSFAKRLGLQASPEEQYVERAVDAWTKGPSEEWLQAAQQHQQQMQQYQMEVAPLIQASQAQSQLMAAQGVQAPPPQLPPAPPAPWSPFQDRAIDTEPRVATIWVTKLRKAIASVKFSEFDPLWQQVAVEKYTAMRQAVATASAAQAQAAQPQQAPQTQPGHTQQPKPAQPQAGQPHPTGVAA